MVHLIIMSYKTAIPDTGVPVPPKGAGLWDLAQG